MLETLKGVILRETPIGDYDKMMTVLTAEHGKISVFAKGAKRLKSPVFTATQLYSYSEMTLTKTASTYYIRNADFMGDNRLAANFEPNSVHFSEDDTREFVDKCNERDTDDSNVLIKTANITSRDDDRPIFIYSYFDRLDEAIDITLILDKLASLGRQVFISVCSCYPEIKHEKVQMVRI